MKNWTETGKKKMFRGMVQLLWEEMKTLNRSKLSGLYKVVSGYIRMKYLKPKRIPAPPKEYVNKDGTTPPLTY